MSSRLRNILQPPRRLRVTREGKWFVFMTVIVGAGAINTANNLLYLMLGMMLGLIILSGMLSELMLQKIRVRRLPAGDLFARTDGHVTFEILNDKRIFASYSIEIVEHEARESRGRRRRAIGLPSEPPRRGIMGGVRDDGDPGPPKALALRVNARGRAIVSGTCSFPLRGLYNFVGIDLKTRFPFGFFEKTRPIEAPWDLLVYPSVASSGDGVLDVNSIVGEVARRSEGSGGEFFGLREYREGDDRRDVHWKVSARRNKLVRRLYEREDNEAVALHLYNWIPEQLPDAVFRAAELEFESAIERAAGLCAHYVGRGYRVSLRTIGEEVKESSGPGQLTTLLRHLALLRLRRDGEPPAFTLSTSVNRVLISTTHTPEAIRGSISVAVEADERPNSLPVHAEAA